MKNPMDILEKVIIPLLTVVGGSGWVMVLLSHRRERKKGLQNYIEEFLEPFDGILKTTSRIFNELRDDRELMALEYHPGRLQEYFAGLTEDDPRKLLWRSRIERLQAENRRAVRLIERFRGQIIREEFKRACEEFKYHVDKWEDLWKAVMGVGAIPISEAQSGVLYAPQFPAELEPALADEFNEARKRSS